MSTHNRELSGSLFKNRKRESDSHPHACGDALIDGQEYFLSAWTKVDRNGNRWQSLSFKKKEVQPAAPKERTYADRRSDPPISDKRHDADIESDIPF